MLIDFIKMLFLTISLSIDALFLVLGYSLSKIKISLKAILLINIMCVLVFSLSISIGFLFKNILPVNLINFFSFLILFLLGIFKILESKIKKVYENKQIKFSFKNISFILNIYIHPEEADKDFSKDISVKEAFFLGLALSLDSLVVGIGVGLMNINFWLILITFVLGVFLMLVGKYLGSWVKTNKDYSWLSGLILILIAIFKL